MRKKFVRVAMTFAVASAIVTGCGSEKEETTSVKETSSNEVVKNLEEDETKDTYSIVYNANGGGTIDNVAEVDNKGILVISEEEPLSPGYDFVGWSFDKEGNGDIYSAGDQVKVDKSGYIYAIWKPKTYTISYVLSDGTNSAANIDSYTYGTEASLYPAARRGYTFKGWYTDNQFNNKIENIDASMTGDIVLYAKFEINQYKVDISLEGGEGIVDLSALRYYNSKYSLMNPSKHGYMFKGWNADGAEVEANEDGTYSITVDANNASLKALWEEIKAEDIELSDVSKKIDLLYDSSSFLLSAQVKPFDSLDQDVFFESSDSSIAEITSDGTITVKKNGVVTITAKTKNGVEKKCVINAVTSPTNKNMYISDQATVLDMTIAPSRTVKATFDANITDNNTVEWTSSNPDIVKVDANGNITGVKVGNATITAKTPNGVTKKCEVTVQASVSSVSINEENKLVDIAYDNGFSLNGILTPEYANVGTELTWESSDQSVVSVDENGNVTVNDIGNSIISATSQNGSKGECNVEVVMSPLAIYSSDININLNDSDEAQITYSFNDEKVNYNNVVSYTSGNTDVLTVDENGLIKALDAGSTTVTLRTPNGVSKTINVNVERPITNVDMSSNTITIDLSGSEQVFDLVATIKPLNTSYNKILVWASDNSNVASVDQNGHVIAKNVGTANITAISTNGVIGKCKVVVNRSVTEVNIKEGDFDLAENDSVAIHYEFNEGANVGTGVSFTSSDESIATIDNVGNITGIACGTAEIKVTTEEGFEDTITVTIKKGVTSFSLDKTEEEINKGTSINIGCIFNEDAELNKEVSYISLNPLVCSVDQNGKVTGLNNGTAVIEVKTVKGLKATCTITVKTAVVEVSFLDKSLGRLDVGNYYQLTYEFNEGADDGTEVTFASSDESIATVDDEGKVFGVSAGTVTITITTRDGYTDTIEITVEEENDNNDDDESNNDDELIPNEDNE